MPLGLARLCPVARMPNSGQDTPGHPTRIPTETGTPPQTPRTTTADADLPQRGQTPSHRPPRTATADPSSRPQQSS
eukprot:3403561-Lingulodinium_polyedra.AAC.1